MSSDDNVVRRQFGRQAQRDTPAELVAALQDCQVALKAYEEAGPYVTGDDGPPVPQPKALFATSQEAAKHMLGLLGRTNPDALEAVMRRLIGQINNLERLLIEIVDPAGGI